MNKPTPQELAAAHAEREVVIAAAFARFMNTASVKLMFSMIPPTEPRELLATLIRTAFDSGSDAGMSLILNPLMSGLLDKK